MSDDAKKESKHIPGDSKAAELSDQDMKPVAGGVNPGDDFSWGGNEAKFAKWDGLEKGDKWSPFKKYQKTE